MSKQSDARHRDYTYDNTLRWTVNPDEEFIRAVSASIISQAVEDWIGLIHLMEKSKTVTDNHSLGMTKQQTCGNASFYEIRRFFGSDYGEMLCGTIDLNPATILHVMEKWLYDYKESGVIPKRIHQLPNQKEGQKCSTRKKSTARSVSARSSATRR